MNKTLILALTVAFSSMASANENLVMDEMKSAEMETTFESIDVDTDGVISMEEVSEHEVLQLAFEELDVDKDGSINEEEYKKLTEVAQ
ncbi:EF-hand domain-containing protein [Psychromonas sp. KJ10-10]|uniref:EF-hand domain-containing protein n=1 Tax=Psychromonas sp. KJ10-10 TaxID=3391823 RepID=UPI0039B512BD